MEASEYQDDTRSVSELYGSVLMVSIALITALILLGLGSVLLDQVASDTEDAIAQDAMLEMDDRLTDIAGSGADATTTFTIPEGSEGDLRVAPEEGVVNISIEADVSGDYLLHTDETSGSKEIELGTIRYIDSNGHVTAYQGGAVFQHQDGYSEILSRPAFDFNGDQIDFSFFNITNLDSIQSDSEVSATMLADESRTSSEELNDWLRQFWVVGSDDTVHAVAPVNITITIESAFADGWGLYALEGMQEEPIEVTIEDDYVEMEFYLGGEPDMTTTPADWDEFDQQNKFIYTGLSQFAQYSNITDPVDGGPAFTITEGDASEEFVAMYHYNPNGPNGWIEFNHNHGRWEAFYPEDYDEHFDPDEDQDDVAVKEPPAGEKIGPGVAEDEDDDYDGEFIYHIKDNIPICIATSSYTEGQFDGDCDDEDNEVMMFQVPDNDPEALIDSTEWMITSAEVQDFSPGQGYTEGETIEVEVTVENQGQETNYQFVQLRNLDGEIVDVTRTEVLAPGEEQEDIPLEWVTEEGDAGGEDPKSGTLEVSTEDSSTTIPDNNEIDLHQGDRDPPDCNGVSYSGGGITGDPYEVSNLAELQCIGDGLVGPTLDDNYVLTDNIDATVTMDWNGGDGFEPIGSESDPFTGTFDGQGHHIEGLTIDRPSEGEPAGLFGAIDDGSVVENVDLVDADIHGGAVTGGLIGISEGTVEHVSVTGAVTSEDGIAGSIVGTMDGNADLSLAYSRADVTGDAHVGGIVGSTSEDNHVLDQLYAAGGELDGGSVGAIAGRVHGEPDTLSDSVYWEDELANNAIGERVGTADDFSIDLPEEDMTGDDAEDEMENLDWNEFRTTENFPAFERGFLVEATVDEDTIVEGEEIEVDVVVENHYDVRKTQDVLLLNTRGHTVDRKSDVELDPGDSSSFTLTWDTQWRDAEFDNDPLVVRSEDSEATIGVTIEEDDAPVDSIGRVVGESDHPIDARSIEVTIR